MTIYQKPLLVKTMKILENESSYLPPVVNDFRRLVANDEFEVIIEAIRTQIEAGFHGPSEILAAAAQRMEIEALFPFPFPGLHNCWLPAVAAHLRKITANHNEVACGFVCWYVEVLTIIDFDIRRTRMSNEVANDIYLFDGMRGGVK